MTEQTKGERWECVDRRAVPANAMRSDAIVSIHADGEPSSGRGFHTNYSSPPLNDAQAGPTLRLAHAMRGSLIASGQQPSTYIGSDGLKGRVKNADEAAQMESADGRAKYAAAVTRGITAYLNAKAATG
jgi:N-acetylmuramoyl-L-alanine amidase